MLAFRRGRDDTGRISGDPARLDLLAEVLGAGAHDEVGGVLLPKDLAAFVALGNDRADLVRDLLAVGRAKVEQVERLVCALYGLPDDLTEAVVQHAVDRAAR